MGRVSFKPIWALGQSTRRTSAIVALVETSVGGVEALKGVDSVRVRDEALESSGLVVIPKACREVELLEVDGALGRGSRCGGSPRGICVML